ncbi:Hypothetical predicted protein [Paramuricea clavata]|uniref:Uncharacterized protein n=1 Tax=Paramuricea clavata TaxID=317549 RepID=A0A7D9LUL1_PARCT|nr:Hypothetical predicted protein [Paramuricea clavata]
MEKEQQEKEQQMRKLAAELELTKQRTEEARKVAELDKSRAENAERQLVEDSKEKLTERDVQAYKYWLIDYAREDCFESLVDWVELRVQVIGEAREETEGFETPCTEEKGINFKKQPLLSVPGKLGITSKIVVKQENPELTDARATTIAVIFMKAPHRMETQMLDSS